MIRVTLDIDNHTAHSCSPLQFLKKFILSDMELIDNVQPGYLTSLRNGYAIVNIKKMEQQ